MRDERVDVPGPWSRFARAFRARRGSRWAWRGLLLCVGLAAFAPLLASELPLWASFRDARGCDVMRNRMAETADTLVTMAVGSRGSSRYLSPELREQLDALDDLLEDGERRASISEVRAALSRLETAEAQPDEAQIQRAGDDLRRIAAESSRRLELASNDLAPLAPQHWWPAFAALSILDIAAMCAWVGIALFPHLGRLVRAASVGKRLFWLFLLSLLFGALAQIASYKSESSAWQSRAAVDAEATLVRTPVAFGPNEVDLARAGEPPGFAREGMPAHPCGTDDLGRDLLARMLYAGRTSFAVAFVAAVLISGIGATLGLAAGALRGVADLLVSRVIELLQAFPTLVLLLGFLAVLPARLAGSRWSVPLLIGLVGWGHVARLARAEALRVGELGFVQAATASGLSRTRVLFRHVLPNSLGPIWIAASFALSAGLVLESSAAFLGFGVQLPAPSFGGLLADARASQAWWLALFPGLWLFAAILSIHLVGEGVRDALDPRDAGVDR